MKSSALNRTRVESLGKFILELEPNAIIRLRILRDVLHSKTEDPELNNARNEAQSHPWVKELEREQYPDGTWGRFHSMDSAAKCRFPTTENAVRRALALGLDIHSPVLQHAVKCMHSMLDGRATWSDRVEKSEGWPITVEAITAATLAEIDPENSVIRPAWEYWVDIASRSFPGGVYDSNAEWNAHKTLRGVGTRYLGSRYVLTLLGAQSTNLPENVELHLVNWVGNNPTGIGYLGADLQHPEPIHIFQWLESLEILSRFQRWRVRAGAPLGWLWEHCGQNRLWDFGARGSRSPYFPLSDDWRRKGNRSIDHSTRVLCCLSTYDPGL